MKGNFSPDCVNAMDHTTLWSNMVGNTAVNATQAKNILLKSTGNRKVRVSVCLTAKVE